MTKEEVKEKLKAIGKTNRWLAEQLGVDETHVSRMLAGRAGISKIAETAIRLIFNKEENK